MKKRRANLVMSSPFRSTIRVSMLSKLINYIYGIKLKAINLSLSSACNADCIYCPTNSGRRIKQKIMPFDYAVTTLDEFFCVHSLNRLDLIKVDVDGPELLILRGGIHIITKYKPVFVVESPFYGSRYGSTFKDIWDFF